MIFPFIHTCSNPKQINTFVVFNHPTKLINKAQVPSMAKVSHSFTVHLVSDHKASHSLTH